MAPTSLSVPASAATVACLSRREGSRPRSTLAVFAHNEGGRIRSALQRVTAAAGGSAVEVWVLANGCTDSTCDDVRACAGLIPDLWLAELPLADKANAWNVFVHELISPERAREVETYFFTDGDVTLETDALALLAATLADAPGASAAGGMPATGRDKTAWRRRMAAYGRLAGALYALRRRFVDAVRALDVRMPVGLIGEDLLLSWLVESDLGQHPAMGLPTRSVFCPRAEFSFRSLSPWRPADYGRYWRRKWRYTLRGLQLEMLRHVLREGGLSAMPALVDDLYRDGPLPSRLRWAGLDTPMRLAAVLGIRRFRV